VQPSAKCHLSISEMIQNSWNTAGDKLSMFEWEVAESMPTSKPSKNNRKAASKVLPDASSPFYTPRLTVDDMASGFSPDPGQCVLWKQQQFRPRVWLAVAHWCGEPPNVLRSNTQLGSLVPQWGIGAQNQLVMATNQQQVFTPFASAMAPPNVLLAADTTIAQWEAIVWTFQNPRTACWGTP
jgi:hypothetical protein